MRRSLAIAAALVVFVLLLATPLPRDALVDDFEADLWLPFAHFHLGDQASAGYSSLLARSGMRSYHVEIHGWKARDFGSAYGYAFFATRGASIADLRLAVLYDSLVDSAPSVWDGFTAGIALELLDDHYSSLGAYHYVAAYRASQNAGRCGPTEADVVLGADPPLGVWHEIARDPTADFPAAPWAGAAFVKVSVGFLCAAGLTGASYSLYADDFSMQTNSGDSDGDGLRDLEEETRVYSVELSDPGIPRSLAPAGETTISLVGPTVSGSMAAGAVSVDFVHPRLDDLSVSLVTRNGTTSEAHLLWDPGVHVRRVAILEPTPGESLHARVRIEGRIAREATGGWLHLLVDGVHRGCVPREDAGGFSFDWNTEVELEGTRMLQVVASESSDVMEGIASEIVPVVVDRTPPELQIRSPSAGAAVAGLLKVELAAYDANGVAAAELWLDGARAEARESEPYVFLYETLDLSNAVHRVEVRARDAAGNLAVRFVDVSVANKANVPPPPCYPACNLTGGTTVGNLAPVRIEPRSFRIELPSHTQLAVVEGLAVPWQPRMVRTVDGVSLVLDILGDARGSPMEGFVNPSLGAYDFMHSGMWRIVVRDHGSGLAGFVQKASVRFAVRTLPGVADTDSDGLSDGAERALSMVPVLADLDGDGLSDAFEMGAHTATFMIDGIPRERVIRTDPFDPDTDDDGLSDGEELFPEGNPNATDPTVADTDADGLIDGAERHTYGTDATRSDTDGDGLLDGFEVQPHEMGLLVDGVLQRRSVVTSPLLRDTDGDGLSDADEWNGASLHGFQTDPSDPDTDHDGLSDGDELRGVNRRPTNPLLYDTDADGLGDSLDQSPLETWRFDWSDRYEPGLARFTQRVHALDVHGTKAEIWTYNLVANTCVYLSDQTADSTRSSDESPANVGMWINKTFLEGGERNYTVAAMRYAGQVGWASYHYQRGACDLVAPRKYVIEYESHDHLYEVDFANVAPVTVADIRGGTLWHTTFEVPLTLGVAETVILQVVVDAGADRGRPLSDGAAVVPTFQYSLHRTSDFLESPSFYQNVAIGAPIDEHVYQFSLRIPEEVARGGNVVIRDGKAYARLALTPLWVNTSGWIPEKTAMLPWTIHVGSVITKVERSAEHIIAELAVDLADLNSVLPPSVQGYATGYHDFGGYTVYVYHLGDAFDSEASSQADAVWISGESEAGVAALQSGISWSPAETWTRSGIDAFGTTLGIMKILRRGLSITGQLTANLVPAAAPAPGWTWSELTTERSYTIVTRIEDAVDWDPIYLVSNSGTNVVNVRTFSPDIEYPITESYTVEWELGNAEILDDLDDSVELAGARYTTLRTGLQGAAIGATLVIFGGQAIMATLDGDAVKATVYIAAGGVSIFGVVESNIVLVPKILQGGWVRSGLALRSGTVAALAAGGLLASYELFLASQSDDAIQKLSHFEVAWAAVVDTILGVIPVYGPALAIGWQLGLGVAVGMQNLLGIVPDALAAKITSSPGATAVFVFEYVIGGSIPSAISQDALMHLLAGLNETVVVRNNSNPPYPTVLVAP